MLMHGLVLCASLFVPLPERTEVWLTYMFHFGQQVKTL